VEKDVGIQIQKKRNRKSLKKEKTWKNSPVSQINSKNTRYGERESGRVGEGSTGIKKNLGEASWKKSASHNPLEK